MWAIASRKRAPSWTTLVLSYLINELRNLARVQTISTRYLIHQFVLHHIAYGCTARKHHSDMTQRPRSARSLQHKILVNQLQPNVTTVRPIALTLRGAPKVEDSFTLLQICEAKDSVTHSSTNTSVERSPFKRCCAWKTSPRLNMSTNRTFGHLPYMPLHNSA